MCCGRGMHYPCLTEKFKHLTKEPTCNSFFKARVAIIDWIGYSIAGTKTEQATVVGKLIAETAKKAGVETVVFDRGGFLYHGRVKALADSAREAGLKF